MDPREVQSLLAYCRLYDIDCVVRPPAAAGAPLARYLEDGATGLMIPHVTGVDQARALVDAVKFPPLGNRGLDGAGVDCDFAWSGGAAYPGEANHETFLWVQIESPAAVDAVESIAAVDGVDGLFVGPGDLGLRLQGTGSHWTLEEVYRAVAAAAAHHGKAWGCPSAQPDDIARLVQLGAGMIAHGNDFVGLRSFLETCAENLRAAGVR